MSDAPIGPLASSGYWLRRSAQQWRRELGMRLRELDLTPTQFDVIAATSWLARSGTAPTQQDIADFSGNDRMMTSKVVRALEARGLVARRPEGRKAARKIDEHISGMPGLTGLKIVEDSLDDLGIAA